MKATYAQKLLRKSRLTYLSAKYIRAALVYFNINFSTYKNLWELVFKDKFKKKIKQKKEGIVKILVPFIF